MKVTYVLTCALVACGLSASAASIEQFLNFSVVGWYQGVSTNYSGKSRERASVVRFNSDNLVHALAIDYDTNFFYGQLIYKTVLDDSSTTVISTNVVIRQRGKTNELDVTSNFTFITGPFVIDQIANTNANVLFTNSYVETGLRSVSFTSSSVSFTNNGGLSTGTLRRTRKIHDTGYADLLTYSGGGGTFMLNTNIFYMTNFQFAATNIVGGPAQINFNTFSPTITTITATFPTNSPSSPTNSPD